VTYWRRSTGKKVIGMSSRYGRRSRVRTVTISVLVIAVPLLILVLIDLSEPGRITVLLLAMAFGLVRLGYLCWQLVTGRYRTARRQAQAEAMTRQRRLETALGHGPYRPETGPPPAADQQARTRQELLDAVERHGGLSPEARAAAEKAKRHLG
jgi:hypothetical protein